MKITSLVVFALFGSSVNGDLIGQNRLANNRLFHNIGRAKFDEKSRSVALGIASHFVAEGEIQLAIEILKSVATPPPAARKNRRQGDRKTVALRSFRTRHAKRMTNK